MPSFSEAERHTLREALLETGYDLFTRYGLKKTSLDDLTRSVGVAKSSFYSFFESKEALYLELLGRSAPAVEAKVEAALRSSPDTAQALARLLTVVVEALETNALTRRLLTHPEELQMIARRVSPEALEAKQRGLLPVLTFVERAQAEGRMVRKDPEVVLGVIRAVTLLTLHKGDIGQDIYPEVMALMTGLVAAGLAGADRNTDRDSVEIAGEKGTK